METKKLIERNLKFSDKYIYLGINRGSVESGNASICDNCGKLITNIVHVSTMDKRHYYIGTDCAETLSKAGSLYNNGSSTDFYVDIYSYNLTARFATELRKGKSYENNGIQLSVENDKGKLITCYLHDMQKFFPELL